MSRAAHRHPRDIDDAALAGALEAATSPHLLRELVDASRRAFGFFTAHHPHTLNYPWVLERLLPLGAGARLLDIGAGVAPLPLVLAGHGMHVTCVDSNKLVRTLPVDDDWNEWGYFDYSQLHANLVSIHGSILDHEPAAPYDAIYSISVLAHMPAVVRRATLERCRRWLRPGGRLLLAVDVIPACDFLWNRSEGSEVEPPVAHGTTFEVAEQLRALELRVVEWTLLRGVPASRTDLLLVHAEAPPAKP
jgi:SAM-dependent methyltransferase